MPDLTLILTGISVTRDTVRIAATISGRAFVTAIRYDSVDFDGLAARYGRAAIDRIAFHIAAFEINKIASLKPARIDWGAYGGFVTPEFADLWRTIFRNVWAQWRFENDLINYAVPDFDAAGSSAAPAVLDPGPVPTLAFCGGGKDSLVALKTLEAVGAPFNSLVYSANFYGDHPAQHALIDGLLAHTAPAHRHRQWIDDDFLVTPLEDLRAEFGIETVTAAETPSSIFAALPLVLQHGYSHICLAHERSADAGQVRWDATGEDVNHQWGKSFEAEALLNGYIQAHLIDGFDYYSILKPLYDVAIFGLLRRYPEAVPATHSCNIDKPWCRRCAKCLYVWLGYAAFLPDDVVTAAFGPENLLDVEDNVFLFRQLAGLEDQLPFECIGEADEAALYLALMEARGRAGKALDACRSAVARIDVAAALDRYLAADFETPNIPASLRPGLEKTFASGAAATRGFAESALSVAA